MRVFVLCTGRSGSVSFYKACSHITNFTAGHESLSDKLGDSRFDYPDFHIEADNRLSWFLGVLGEKFSDDDTLYVHLLRDRDLTARSFIKRWNAPGGIIAAFYKGILKSQFRKPTRDEILQVCLDYVDTVNTNIAYFLRDKPNVLTVRLDTIKEDFKKFWGEIDAAGELERALQEFDVAHNSHQKKSFQHILYRLKLLFQ